MSPLRSVEGTPAYISQDLKCLKTFHFQYLMQDSCPECKLKTELEHAQDKRIPICHRVSQIKMQEIKFAGLL